MKFKIREVTYTNGGILYYPMVKKGFWGWFYIYRLGCDLAEAHKYIVTYKKEFKKQKPIIRDILID